MGGLRLVLFVVLVGGCGRSLPVDGRTRASARYVAVGGSGRAVVSLDGLRWSDAPTGTDQSLLSVAAGAARFVAVGAAGTIVASSDGMDWTTCVSGTKAELRHVIFTGEKFLAVGGSWDTGAAMVESTDGERWTVVSAPPNYQFRAVAQRAGTVIAAANYKSDLQTPALFTTSLSTGSAAGTWSQQLGPEFDDSVTVGDRIVVVGSSQASTSHDGLTWNSQQLPTRNFVVPPDRAIAHSGQLFVAVGQSGGFSSSPDGVRWTEAASTRSGGWLSGVAWGAPGGFVAVGAQGTIVTSPDGSVWSSQTLVPQIDLHDVAFGP